MALSKKLSSKIYRSSRQKKMLTFWEKTSKKSADIPNQISGALASSNLAICACLIVIFIASVTTAKTPDQEAIHHKNGMF